MYITFNRRSSIIRSLSSFVFISSKWVVSVLFLSSLYSLIAPRELGATEPREPVIGLLPELRGLGEINPKFRVNWVLDGYQDPLQAERLEALARFRLSSSPSDNSVFSERCILVKKIGILLTKYKYNKSTANQ